MAENSLFTGIKKGVTFIVALVVLVVFSMAPVTTRAMTIGEERDIGERLLYSVRGEFPILDAPDISRYINDLGNEVLEIVGPQFFDYHFFVVKSEQFNAFAAPAGLVFFFTGLIETMKSEDELLSVLAHEIGHVVSRHIAKRLEKSGKINMATMVLGLASLALGVPALSQGLLTGSMAAGQSINLKYSRDDEEQADRLSFDWMQQMHRNPIAMKGMLRAMRRITRYRSGKLPQYLLTHPNPEARLNYVASLIELDSQQANSEFYQQTDNFSFLRFKYRVMLQSIDFDKFRVYCANTVASSKNREQQVMANYGLSLIAMEEHSPDKALHYLNIVQKAFPEQEILNIDMATIYLENGQLDKAQFLLRKAVDRDPTDMYAVYQLARCEQKRGNQNQAKKHLLVLAKDMPDFSQVYYELGRIAANQSEHGLSQFYLGKYYLYEGRIKTAKKHLENSQKDRSIPEQFSDEATAILDRLEQLDKET